ncbi:MAG: hypothetical protein JXL81_14125 [Deltaproteobacteria bacterium]|nr:hypothetical protein [Deltaproteobacteria bacterium]
MYSNKFLSGFFSWFFSIGKKDNSEYAHNLRAILFFFGVALVLSTASINNARASEHQDPASIDNHDARWLPWIGTWRLVSNKVNTSESPSSEDYFLKIEPGSSNNSIIMKGNQGDKVLVEEELIADGLRHPLNDEKCSGYYNYSWSETGKRLLLKSESNCPGDPLRKISGMSIIDKNRDWIDIQLLLNNGEKAISIRRYRNIDNDSVSPAIINPDNVGMARIAAGKDFSIDEIIELSSKVETEVLEAALLETRTPFPINSSELAKLSDSGVNSRIVDLMVAFSFPEKFTVEEEKISLAQFTGPQGYYSSFRTPYRHYSYHCPILPWHWTSSSYMSYYYGYSYLGWYLGDGWYYPFWSYPPEYYYGGGGGGTPSERGTLIRGQGYTVDQDSSSGTSTRRAQPRYAPSGRNAPVQPGSSGAPIRRAVPRNAPAVRSTPVQPSSSFSSGGSTSGYSGGSSTTSSSSSSGSPSASPNGYSGGR